jgi:hypothetical protein
MVVALFLIVAASLPLQARQASSLADVARQARAEKQTQPKVENNQAQQVAEQLAEDQDDRDAPAGFKTYNAGDYKLWVPAPYKLAGNDDGGAVLSGPGAGNTRTLVLAGNPIVLKLGQNEDAFRDAATEFARGYLQSAKCTKTTFANHSAYQCGLAGANLLGSSVSGQAVLIKGSTNIFPVICAAPTDSRARDILNSPHSSYVMKRNARLVMDREEQEVRAVWQKCESVLQSIHLREDGARQAGMPTSSPDGRVSAKPADTKAVAGNPSAPQEGPAQAGNASGPPSLAEIARRLHESPAQATTTPIAAAGTGVQSTVPAGLKVHSFNYCKSHTQCWDASVFVPADAQLVSSDCKQYVFETKVKGVPYLLLAGPGGTDSCDGRSANDPSLVRWNQLVAPETARAPGTASTVSTQQTTLDGKPAVITTMRFKKGMADWMGKRAEVDANGIQIVVGCMGPREQFPDGDTICSALIGSLRLP